jgi:hypothetical protein
MKPTYDFSPFPSPSLVKGLGIFFVFVFKTHLKLHTLNLINSLFQCNRFCNFLAVKFFTCKIQRAFLNSINPEVIKSKHQVPYGLGVFASIRALDEISKIPACLLACNRRLTNRLLQPENRFLSALITF